MAYNSAAQSPNMSSTTTQAPAKPEAVHIANTQVPDWELPLGYAPDKQRRRNLFRRPDFVGLYKKMETKAKESFFGRHRKTACFVVFIAFVALITGLAVGLTAYDRHKHKNDNLPLPTNKDTQTGDLTYYDPGLGACGIASNSGENIVAVSHLVFDAAQTGSNPNANPLCGKKIRASRYFAQAHGQRSVDLTVVDRCVGCAATDIDVTISAFKKLAEEAEGRVNVQWAWLD
ncbi:hypothetical protein K402DRAFT_397274 [Aulographum hederae CBS 113979]|uniref:RlpA-like protein double-psi beta-barrel domain-containing protein n=1 Tax=Aulographum hederae CBS 113979 TaxID=1176131 RepID=A0A6G1GPQ6_9PEZI|nr:hypothetical protein K402DRAFT_397274 [Aulographum hederae CBS 113979]